MTVESAMTWFPMVQWLLTLGALGFAYWVRSTVHGRVAECEEDYKGREAAMSKRIADGEAALHQRINDVRERLTRLEAAYDAMPRRQDVHEIALTCTQLAGTMTAFKTEMSDAKEVMRATQASIQRVNDFLLNEKKNS